MSYLLLSKGKLVSFVNTHLIGHFLFPVFLVTDKHFFTSGGYIFTHCLQFWADYWLHTAKIMLSRSHLLVEKELLHVSAANLWVWPKLMSLLVVVLLMHLFIIFMMMYSTNCNSKKQQFNSMDALVMIMKFWSISTPSLEFIKELEIPWAHATTKSMSIKLNDDLHTTGPQYTHPSHTYTYMLLLTCYLEISR